jgi:hypothetical protein
MDAAAFERRQAEQDQLVQTVDELYAERDTAFQEQAEAIFLAEEKIEEARSAQGSLTGKGLSSFPHRHPVVGSLSLARACRRGGPEDRCRDSGR